MTGREIATLVNGRMNAGAHTVTFNASNLSSEYLCIRSQWCTSN